MRLSVQGEVLDVELFDQSPCVMIIFVATVKVFPKEVGSTYSLTYVISTTSSADSLSLLEQSTAGPVTLQVFILRFASIHAFESPLPPPRGLPSWSWTEDLLGVGLSVTLVCHSHKQVFGEQNS